MALRGLTVGMQRAVDMRRRCGSSGSVKGRKWKSRKVERRTLRYIACHLPVEILYQHDVGVVLVDLGINDPLAASRYGQASPGP